MIRRNLKRIGAFTIGVWIGCAYGAVVAVNAKAVLEMLP